LLKSFKYLVENGVEKKQAKHGLAMKKLANAGLTQSIYFQELSAFL
jgi:hypothetical protein